MEQRSVAAASIAQPYSVSADFNSEKNKEFYKMTKFRKGNVYAFKRKNVPNNKSVRKPKAENLPAPYKRLPKEMEQLVRNPLSASKSQEMAQRSGAYRLLHPCLCKGSDKIDNQDVNKSNK